MISTPNIIADFHQNKNVGCSLLNRHIRVNVLTHNCNSKAVNIESGYLLLFQGSVVPQIQSMLLMVHDKQIIGKQLLR